ncbi:MAG: tetratricopeptide repeat protein [Opitutae bacterium]|nr:tetratricopeptide repeat protein [Opitutae bacterium]
MRIILLTSLMWGLAVAPGPGRYDAMTFEMPEDLFNWKEEDFEKRFKGSYGINSYLEPELDVDNFNVYEGVLAYLEYPEEAIAFLINGMANINEQGFEVSATLNFLLGNFYFETNDHSRAIEQYISAIHKHPDFLRAYENLGYSFMLNDEKEKALPVLLKAIELGSNDSQIHGLIGFLYLEKELYLSAMAAYEIAMLFNPRNNTWRFGILQCLINLGRNEDALGVAEEVLLFDPDRAANWKNVANLLLRIGRYDEAAAHLEVMHRLGGASYESRRLLGNLYFTDQNIESAFREFLQLLDLLSDGEQLNDILLVCQGLLIHGYAEEARTLISKSREKSRQEDLRLNAMVLDLVEGLIFLETHQLGQAESTLARVLEVDPANPRALLAMGEVYLRSGKWDQAVLYLELAELNPEVAYDAYNNHARLLLGLGQTQEALEKFRAAYSLDSNEELLEIIRSLEESGRLMP